METQYINMIPERKTEIFHASQNDNRREIRCGLYDTVFAKALTGAEDIALRYKKPSGTIGSMPIANTANTYVDISIPNTMTDEAGRVYCKLRIDGIGAKAFFIEVEGRP